MMRVMPFLRRFLRNESGTSTIEFVIIAPVFFMFLFMGVELGLTMTRQVMLDRAVDISVRSLRLGHIQNPTIEDLRDNICASSSVIRDCNQNLLLELRRVNTTTWNYPGDIPACVNRAENLVPPTSVTGGGSNDLMLLRACLIIDPLFPTSRLGLGLPLDASGGYQMYSISSFVNEPR